jgi:hypothetical protein
MAQMTAQIMHANRAEHHMLIKRAALVLRRWHAKGVMSAQARAVLLTASPHPVPQLFCTMKYGVGASSL